MDGGGRSESDPAVAGTGVPLLARPLTARDRTQAVCALLLGALAIATFWPGIATYDTIRQYAQVLSGEWDDWHPPAMARLWGVLAWSGPGAAPMLVLQLVLYWCGAALLAGALARVGRRGAAWAVVAVAVFPPLAGWQGVVLKDAQMTGALFAAVGLVVRWRLAGRRVPVVAAAGAAVLIGYATAVRGNAAFATMPLAVLLVRPRLLAVQAAAICVAGIALVLVLLPIANHGLLGAGASGVERTEAVYDLAGVAVRSDASGTPFTADQRAALARRGCVRPFFWDPLGEASRCGDLTAPLVEWPAHRLYRALALAVMRHPLAYSEHRLAHLNSTERWLVPWNWPDAAPPSASEKNDLGLGSPGAVARWWQWLAALLVLTPLAWPVVMVVTGGATLWAGRRSTTPAGELARALLVSALTLEASFAVLSIASDLRYHLWPMLAVALAWVLLWAELPRTTMRVAVVALVLVVGAGLVARVVLAPAPVGYRAMLG